MAGDPFDLLGDTLDGQFRVEAFVGEGDLTIVYKGHRVSGDAPVAIKCLNLPETLDPALTRPVVESFAEAGRLHSRLARGNPNIVQAIASGKTVAPRTGVTVPYLVREWLEGESLASQLARRRLQGSKGRSIDETIALLEPAIEGVAYAHAQGVAHLSLDPGNLFVAQTRGTSSLKVLDFGVVRTTDRVAQNPAAASLSTKGFQVLRPAYAAPEQLDKEAGKPGTWSDVYSLALVMMEVLSDRAEMQGSDTPAMVERALDDRRRPTPQAHGLTLPPGLDRVLTRAVARSPEDRPKDARTFWKDVKAALQGAVSMATPGVRAPPAVPKPSPQSKPEPPPAKRAAPGPLPAPVNERPAAMLAGVAPPLPAPTPAPPATPQGPLAADPVPPAAATPRDPLAAEARPSRATAPTLDPGAPLPPVPPLAAAPLVVDPPEPEFTVGLGPSLRKWLMGRGSSVRARLAGGWSSLEPWLMSRRSSLRAWLGGRSFSRRTWLIAGGAALALVTLVAMAATIRRAPQTSVARAAPEAVAPAAPGAPAASAPLPAAPTAAPSSPSPVATPALAEPSSTPPVVPPAEPAAGARVSAARAHPRKMSQAEARRAINAVSRKVARCRHGRFWGNGYATVVFANDGAVDRVLVDPPFSMTVAGRCVAGVLSSAHMPAFDGRPGLFRLRFYIAPR